MSFKLMVPVTLDSRWLMAILSPKAGPQRCCNQVLLPYPCFLKRYDDPSPGYCCRFPVVSLFTNVLLAFDLASRQAQHLSTAYCSLSMLYARAPTIEPVVDTQTFIAIVRLGDNVRFDTTDFHDNVVRSRHTVVHFDQIDMETTHFAEET